MLLTGEMNMNGHQPSNVGQDTRLLRDDELNVVNGGIIIIGGNTLGGPDTRYFGDLGRPYLGSPEERTF